MKLSKHFKLEELVHPVIFKRLGARSKSWLNPSLIITLESLRETLATPITVNNWHTGGSFKDSGLRCPTDPLNGKPSLSGHYGGTCADPKFSKVKPEKVYFHILNNQHKYPFIVRMENIEHTPTWVHIEVSTDEREGDIYIFNP